MGFTIWRITDGKAGHDSQSIGLCNAIKRIKDCEIFETPAESLSINIKNFFLNQFPIGKNIPDPDLIISAGHCTHLSLLCAKRARGGKTIVLMKPSLPISWFDLCIVPEHDQLNDRHNVIKTNGAINPVQFNQDKTLNIGLILLGGPSKHYNWNENDIIDQINQIIDNSPDIKWVAADSPRTPKTTIRRLTESKNVQIKKFENTNSEELRDIIFKTKKIWVSKDSVSMIYESLSSGASVGVLDVEQNKNNKISDAVTKLINNNQLITFNMWKNNKEPGHTPIKFNEADRCASLLLDRGLLNE
jgi:uncharacterized protein